MIPESHPRFHDVTFPESRPAPPEPDPYCEECALSVGHAPGCSIGEFGRELGRSLAEVVASQFSAAGERTAADQGGPFLGGVAGHPDEDDEIERARRRAPLTYKPNNTIREVATIPGSSRRDRRQHEADGPSAERNDVKSPSTSRPGLDDFDACWADPLVPLLDGED